MTMKNFFIKFNYALLIVGGVLVLVLFRLSDESRFENGAAKNAQPAFSGDNLWQPLNSKLSDTTTLIIYINSPKRKDPSHPDFIEVEMEHILDQQFVKKLKQHDGNIALFADNPTVLARSWMLLAQKGVNNCYIVTENVDEQFKHQFHPDSALTGQ